MRYEDWEAVPCGEKTENIAARVLKAIEIQRRRYGASGAAASNAFMTAHDMRLYCSLPSGASNVLETAMNRLGFSARSLDKILRVARTIADLEGSAEIKKQHIMEAVQYRIMDKNDYGGI